MTATMYEQIRYEVADEIATLTLDRPDRRNGYTEQMADELAAALRQADADDAVRVVVLTGAGKDFCVGADLDPNRGFGGDEAADWVEPASRVTRPMWELHKPVIAVVRGAAVGVGSTMILPADFRLAATDTRFGFVFSRRGIYPEGGSQWFLPRLVGAGRAADWMLTGRLVPAAEALAAGLVTAVHEPDDVLDAGYALASELVTHCAPVSMSVIRKGLHRMSAFASPEPVWDLDSKLIASAAGNPDATEGIASFFERRDPRWTLRAGLDDPEFLPWR